MEPLLYIVALWLAWSSRGLWWRLFGPSVRYLLHRYTGY